MESLIVGIVFFIGICLFYFILPVFKKNQHKVMPVNGFSGHQNDYSQFSVSEAVDKNNTPSAAHEMHSYSVDMMQNNTLQESNMIHHATPEDTLLVLSVMAKNGARFASYELLQAISSAGLKFGEMNIFHYIYPEDSCGIKLFSLVSAEEPGEFNLDRMGDFSCPGLMLFMDSARVPDPKAALNMMLEKAEQLAEDLDGELFADPKTPWNQEVEQLYKHKVAYFVDAPTL